MKKVIILIGMSMFFMISCKPKPADTNTIESSTTTTDLLVNPNAMVQMEINVQGMTCTGCESTINAGVSEIAGVVEVKSSYLDGITYVKYDSTMTDIMKVSKVIASKGYVVKGYEVYDTTAMNTATTEVK